MTSSEPLEADVMQAIREAMRALAGGLSTCLAPLDDRRVLVLYGDGSLANDVVLGGPRVGFDLCLDLRLLPDQRRGERKFAWLTANMLSNRVVWVSRGPLGRARELGAELARAGLRRVSAVRGGAALGPAPAPSGLLLDELAARFEAGVVHARGNAHAARVFGGDFPEMARSALLGLS